MSEYELASLALEHAAGRYAVISLIQGTADSLNAIAALTFSVLFGYLIVAYLAASDLSRVQMTILNSLYLVVMASNMVSMMTAHAGGKRLHDTLQLLTPVSERAPELLWSNSALVANLTIMALLIAASLWFMWNSSNSKAQ